MGKRCPFCRSTDTYVTTAYKGRWIWSGRVSVCKNCGRSF